MKIKEAFKKLQGVDLEDVCDNLEDIFTGRDEEHFVDFECNDNSPIGRQSYTRFRAHFETDDDDKRIRGWITDRDEDGSKLYLEIDNGYKGYVYNIAEIVEAIDEALGVWGKDSTTESLNEQIEPEDLPAIEYIYKEDLEEMDPEWSDDPDYYIAEWLSDVYGFLVSSFDWDYASDSDSDGDIIVTGIEWDTED